ncbi:hypothetical protein [Delftia sp. UME58]|uniref:hypothetical protein n=1 Tax=Delftia sp. UME58 TaxID=1862322 RepID=UPI001603F582|nr:hypothetical protein [Delftia sp. UME58]
MRNCTFSGHQVGQWSRNADDQFTCDARLPPFDAIAQPEQTQVQYTPQGHTVKESSDQGGQTRGYNVAQRLIRGNS